MQPKIKALALATATPAVTASQTIITDASGNVTVPADLTVTGNMTISGTTTIVNSTEVDIGDSMIRLNSTSPGSISDGGIEIYQGVGNPIPSMIWNHILGKWGYATNGSGFVSFASAGDSAGTVDITNITTGGTVYPVWASAVGAGQALHTTSAALTFTPSTNTLFSPIVSATTFSGAGTGLTGTASSLSIGGTATNVTGIVTIANGGTGTTTAFTQGSIVFAGSSGTYTQNNSSFFWDSASNVLGLGTATPATSGTGGLTATVLQGYRTGVSAVASLVSDTGNATYIGQVYAGPNLFTSYRGYRFRGTQASPSVPLSNDPVVVLDSLAFDGTSSSSISRISQYVDTITGINDMSGYMAFSTRPGGASLVERLRISKDGAFGLSGANYGTSGQVLTSNGSTAAPTWQTVTAGATDAGTLTGTTLAANVVNSSLTSVGTLGSLTVSGTTSSGTFSGSGSGLTSIPNSALVNSSITVGSTGITLGGTATTLAGLSSITSTTFVGALTGAASLNVLKAGDTMSGMLINTNGEILRGANNSTFISGYNAGQTVRTGFLQFISGSDVTLKAEQTNPLILSTTGGNLTIATGGAATFSSTVSASNLSGTNTGDQTITLTGDVTGSGTGSFATTLATVNSNVGTFAVVTVNAKGLVTAATTLTGDITSSGASTTLATVNSNVGTFGISTSIPSFTVNAKGLITAASGNAVVAPAGTLTGTTLASGVTTSSLTSVGTLSSLTVSGAITATGTASAFADGSTVNGIDIGYRSIPRSTTTTTAVIGDRAKCIALTAGITIPASVFAAGDAVTFYNDSGSSVTITQGAGLTMYLAGSATTGNRTLAQRGMCTMWFNSATAGAISGAGLT